VLPNNLIVPKTGRFNEPERFFCPFGYKYD
jgi:hypothetical protein